MLIFQFSPRIPKVISLIHLSKAWKIIFVGQSKGTVYRKFILHAKDVASPSTTNDHPFST